MRVLLRVALEETGFRTSLAGAPFGEQALVNVERALEIAGRWDATGKGDAPALAAYLMSLTDDVPYEAHPEEDSRNSRAVQLLTIHQAKGLEWPIVAIPDLAGQRIRSTGRILFDRRLGLAIKPSLPDELEIRRSPRVQQIWAELGRRDEAEYLRLLYVAVTRARDHLILSGQTERPGGTWREMLEQVIRSERTLRPLVAEIDIDTLPAGRPMSAPSMEPSPESVERLDVAVKRVRDVKLPSGSAAVFPVTHLQDYFLCPRRYLYARQLGLSEFPLVYELQAETEEENQGRSTGDHRMRGTLVHRILEQVDLRLIHEPNLLEHVRSLLWAEGLDPSARDTGEVVQWILAFLKTPFAFRISARPDRVHRELPFLLRLAGEEEQLAVYLKGQIDLLFEEEDGSATIVDYKASVRHPAGLSPYAFQLDCYALAGSRFVQTGVPIRTGIAFLRGANPEPEMRPVGEVASKALEKKLILGAQALLRATRSLDWPGLPQAECAAIACGYQYRCHANSSA
jgi:ATP-dependent exoDNAse (exonuclease V) beta subunit